MRQVVQNGAEVSAPKVFSVPRETKIWLFDLFVELRMRLITGLLNDKHMKANSCNGWLKHAFSLYAFTNLKGFSPLYSLQNNHNLCTTPAMQNEGRNMIRGRWWRLSNHRALVPGHIVLEGPLELSAPLIRKPLTTITLTSQTTRL